MAQDALKKLEGQINCSICLDTYTDPKELLCHHVYCQTCLVKLVIRDQQGQLTLACPTCRQVTLIPANGVAGLPSAFHINSLLEIYECFKQKDTSSAAPVATPKANVCFTHNKELELYCETCEELICLECVVKGGKHHSHDSELLEKAVTKYEDEFTSSLKPMEKQVTGLTRAIAEIDERCSNITSQQGSIETEIDKTFTRLQAVLDSRKSELIGQLHEITKGKLVALERQKNRMQTALTQISSCLEFIRAKLGHGSEGEVVKMKTTVWAAVKRAKSLTSAFQMEPNTDADIIFSHPAADLTAQCQSYGDVSAPEMQMAYSSNCYATGSGLAEGTVGQNSTVILHAVNFKGQPSDRPIKSLKCKLVSKTANTTTKVWTKKSGLNQYEISYQPAIEGKHQLQIKVEGQNIRGSPFLVNVLPPQDGGAGEQEGNNSILTLERVEKPCGVAISHAGEVVVTESGAYGVSIFNTNGLKLRSFGGYGSLPGQFKYPHGVAVDGEGNIWVADCENHHIQKFSTDGTILASIGNKEGDRVHFRKPIDIAFNSRTNQLCVVDESHHVKVLNSDLTLSHVFGEKGSGKGQFHYPYAVTCDGQGCVYVVDNRNNRIQVFTAEGAFLRLFGGGEGQGSLNGPVGIALDEASQLVYVSDCNHQISVFSLEGELVKQFCQYGVRGGELKYPCGLALDNTGVLYVCDNENYRLQYFSMHD